MPYVYRSIADRKTADHPPGPLPAQRSAATLDAILSANDDLDEGHDGIQL
jgi:hypothetical protein